MRGVRAIVGVAIVGLLASCQRLPASSAGARAPGLSLAGVVSYGAERQVQATMAEVADKSTVSLIDTTTDTTVATTVTDSTGNFLLNLPGWNPTPNEVYYLEAVKGLYNNVAGHNAARVRTLIEYTSNNWVSIVNAPIIYLNPSTTALSIIESLQGATAVPPTGLIGAMPTTSTFNATGTNVSQSDFGNVVTMVNSILTGDGDPIAGVKYSGGQYQDIFGTGGVVIGSASPSAGPVGTVVTITGSGFSSTIASDSILFDGIAAPISTVSAAGDSLTTTVPGGASTGPITIWVSTASGSQGATGLNFSVSGTMTGTVASQSAGTITGSVPLQ